MEKFKVLNVVKSVFEGYGYVVELSEEGDLTAEKKDDFVVVRFEPKLDREAIDGFVGVVSKRKLLISERVSPELRSFALSRDIIVWDKGELEAQIGRSVLGEKGSWDIEKRIRRWPYTPKKVRPLKHNTEPDRVVSIVLKSIPLKISRDDAVFLARQPGGEVKDCSLKFNPLWIYNFSFNVQKNFKSKIARLASSGAGFVDGLTGDNSFSSYHEFQERVELPTPNYEIRDARVSREDALKIAIGAVIHRNTKEIRLNEMIGDTIISERKIIAPEPGEIKISMELVYIPIWEVNGIKLVKVNANNGQIISNQEYYDAEFL